MRNKKNINRPIFLFVFGVALFILVVSSWLNISSPVVSNQVEKVNFNIQKGEALDSVIKRLKEKNLIRSRTAMKITILRLDLAKKIQAGEFFISPSWTLREIAQTLTSGRSDIKVTLVEGLRREEVAEKLEEVLGAINFNKSEFLEITEKKEGYLFPDTYFLPKDINTKQVVDILLTNFENKVDDSIKAKIVDQDLSIADAVIIASLVEREAKFEADRPLVAGILIKRWKADWGLEVDASVQYAIGYQKQSETWWKKSLTKTDIQTKSPYNTYLYSGLPPAPICNPSLSSIVSVAEARPSEYWFYISDAQGNLHYAKTIEEHNANIRRYLTVSD